MNRVAIFSVPRSGSTWLGQLFNSSPTTLYKFQPNFAYSFEPRLSEHSSTKEINLFFEELIKTNDPFVNAEVSISSKKNILFKKETIDTILFKETHYLNVIENLLKKSDTKVIGLVRSPFAVINSWLKIPKEFDPSWDVKQEWKYAIEKNQNKASNFFGYNKWLEATLMFVQYQKEFGNQFIIINYDDLLKDTLAEVKRLFNFCEIHLNKQTRDFIESSKKKQDNDAYSVFKQKTSDDQWKNELPKFIIEEIKQDKEFIALNDQFQWL